MLKGSDNLTGIHDAGRVEGSLHPAHQVDRHRRRGGDQFVALQLADAVLGRDRTVKAAHDIVHGLVHGVVEAEKRLVVAVDRPGDVIVEIAVAHVAEADHAGARH